MAIDPLSQVLIEEYRKAYIELQKTIIRKGRRGNVTDYHEAIMEEVLKNLKILDERADEWANSVVPAVYEDSSKEMEVILSKIRRVVLGAGEGDSDAGKIVTADRMAKLHESAIKAVVSNFKENIHTAHRLVGRRTGDVLREEALKATSLKLTTGGTLKEMCRNLLNRYAEKGILVFVNKAGYECRIEDYVKMVCRSTVAETTNTGALNQLVGMGRDLVRMTEHFGACGMCAPLQGRVYSISGKDSDYPPLSMAFNEYMTVHPNCRHRIVPYIPELDPEREQTKEFSNRNFDEDPRSRLEKKMYATEQRINVLRNKERKLKEKLLLGEVIDFDMEGIEETLLDIRREKKIRLKELREMRKESSDIHARKAETIRRRAELKMMGEQNLTSG